MPDMMIDCDDDDDMKQSIQNSTAIDRVCMHFTAAALQLLLLYGYMLCTSTYTAVSHMYVCSASYICVVIIVARFLGSQVRTTVLPRTFQRLSVVKKDLIRSMYE